MLDAAGVAELLGGAKRKRGELRDAIARVMLERGEAMHAHEIARSVGRTTNQIGTILARLIKRGVVVRESRGFYSAARA
jgi:predicted transcriptional regulator